MKVDITNILIRCWKSSDMQRTFELIRKGEFLQYSSNPEVSKEAKDFIELSVKQDLSNIYQTYLSREKSPKSMFWIAEDCENSYVCGMVGLEYKSDENAELRRMFVDEKYQSRKIGSKLINELKAFAKSESYKYVYLSTPAESPAVQFYLKHDFKIVQDIFLGSDNCIHLSRMVWEVI